LQQFGRRRSQMAISSNLENAQARSQVPGAFFGTDTDRRHKKRRPYFFFSRRAHMPN
jgi:hypothetical protein